MWFERARARVAPASSADSEVPKPERPPSCRSAPGFDRARLPGRPSRSASLCRARQPWLRKARSGFSRGDARWHTGRLDGALGRVGFSDRENDRS